RLHPAIAGGSARPVIATRDRVGMPFPEALPHDVARREGPAFAPETWLPAGHDLDHPAAPDGQHFEADTFDDAREGAGHVAAALEARTIRDVNRTPGDEPPSELPQAARGDIADARG